ncbi:MAG: ATP-binding cassette domain-containing protein [Acidobacteria bacterium]|nr:ATP-binding cassette domain-containing protein [Acidobacteriota bacterium]
MDSNAAVIEFEQVSYRVAGKLVLDDFSLRVMPGETLVLLGRSGSGKTTALRLVNGLISPTSGVVRVLGRPVAEWNLIELRRSIGYVIQSGGLFPHLTAGDNIALGPKLAGRTCDVDGLLDRVGLPAAEFRGRRPLQLSGGERQRVSVARALASDPPLLLLDEPFSALDPITRFELQQEFVRWRTPMGKTAVFVTHDLTEALRVGTRIGVMADGALESCVPTGDFKRFAGVEGRRFLEAFGATL